MTDLTDSLLAAGWSAYQINLTLLALVLLFALWGAAMAAAWVRDNNPDADTDIHKWDNGLAAHINSKEDYK